MRQWNDTAVPANLIRNDLAAQNDGNAVMVATGAMTNLSRLLALHDTAPLITAKVKMLVIAGGGFAAGAIDSGFAADATAAKHVLAEWPTPIVFCGREMEKTFLFPGQCIGKDFSYVPVHPIVEAYRAYRAMPYDAPACALAAMLYAVRPGDGYFTASKSGAVSLGSDGRTSFSESAGGKHTYLTAVAAKHDEAIQKFTTMVSAEPVVIRPFRKQQKEEPPKEADPKEPAGKS